MASNITVSNLRAAPGAGHIALEWSYVDPNLNGLPYLQLDVVEVHAASTNNRADASKVAEGINNGLHAGLTQGQTRYYWIRAKDRSGNYGDWFPSSATGGVTGVIFTDASAWTAYTPTVTGQSGTVGDATAVGAYKIVGQTVHFYFNVSLNLVGTAAGSIRATLPIAPVAGPQLVFPGARIYDGNFASLCCISFPLDRSNVRMRMVDGTFPGLDESGFFVSGSYPI